MSRKKQVDAIDIQILNIIQQDGRISSKGLARQIGLSESPTLRRLRNLFKRGIVRKVVSMINYEMFDLKYQAIILVNVFPGKRGWFISKLEEKLNVLLVFEIQKQDMGLTKNTFLYAWIVAKSKNHFKEQIREIILTENALFAFEFYEITSRIYDNPYIRLTVDDQF